MKSCEISLSSRKTLEGSFEPYALTFSPQLEERVWGGRKLARFGKLTPPEKWLGKRIGESWEISDVEGKPSTISRGIYAGCTLRELLHHHPEPLLGGPGRKWSGPFPLLLKLLDAQENLSIQVHPSDEDLPPGSRQGGKTEAWVILESEKGKVAHGLPSGVKKAELYDRMEALHGKALSSEEEEALFRWVEVEPGDVVFVPAGMIHAIGKGVLLLEVQQTSDITYRVYDWGRPRELHLKEARKVADPEPVRCPLPNVQRAPDGKGFVPLLSCDKFQIETLSLGNGSPAGAAARASTRETSQPRFQILAGLEGAARYEGPGGDRLEIGQGQFTLLPAALGEYVLAAEGPARVLRFQVPLVG